MSGNPPPEGTVTWPWWDSIPCGAALNQHALGSSYHGNVYAQAAHTDLALFEKEISHTDGYGKEQRGIVRESHGLPPSCMSWFVVKFVCRAHVAG
jgi:hypothetical protein